MRDNETSPLPWSKRHRERSDQRRWFRTRSVWLGRRRSRAGRVVAERARTTFAVRGTGPATGRFQPSPLPSRTSPFSSVGGPSRFAWGRTDPWSRRGGRPLAAGPPAGRRAVEKGDVPLRRDARRQACRSRPTWSGCAGIARRRELSREPGRGAFGFAHERKIATGRGGRDALPDDPVARVGSGAQRAARPLQERAARTGRRRSVANRAISFIARGLPAQGPPCSVAVPCGRRRQPGCLHARGAVEKGHVPLLRMSAEKTVGFGRSTMSGFASNGAFRCGVGALACTGAVGMTGSRVIPLPESRALVSAPPARFRSGRRVPGVFRRSRGPVPGRLRAPAVALSSRPRRTMCLGASLRVK